MKKQGGPVLIFGIGSPCFFLLIFDTGAAYVFFVVVSDCILSIIRFLVLISGDDSACLKECRKPA